MQSGYSEISPKDFPVLPHDVVEDRGAVASTLGATVPVSSKRTVYPGIDKVLAAASELVTRYTGDERIRSRALQITSSVRRHPATGQPDLRNVDGITTAIYTWMVRNINYVADPWDVERIQAPPVTLKQKTGDCDDHAILSAALLQTLGVYWTNV